MKTYRPLVDGETILVGDVFQQGYMFVNAEMSGLTFKKNVHLPHFRLVDDGWRQGYRRLQAGEEIIEGDGFWIGPYFYKFGLPSGIKEKDGSDLPAYRPLPFDHKAFSAAINIGYKELMKRHAIRRGTRRIKLEHRLYEILAGRVVKDHGVIDALVGELKAFIQNNYRRKKV